MGGGPPLGASVGTCADIARGNTKADLEERRALHGDTALNLPALRSRVGFLDESFLVGMAMCRTSNHAASIGRHMSRSTGSTMRKALLANSAAEAESQERDGRVSPLLSALVTTGGQGAELQVMTDTRAHACGVHARRMHQSHA